MDFPHYAYGAGALILATSVGSFVGCLVDRVPRAEPLLWARSCCRECKQILSVRQLVPVLSFLAQRGRCQFCRAQIPPSVLLVELIAALPLVLLLWLPPGQAVAGIVLCWLLLLLASFDVATGRLPDALTGALTLAGFSAALLLGGGLFNAAIGVASGFALLAVVAWGYRAATEREGLGGGDIKLLAALGAWVGWQGVPWLLLTASVSGLVFAVISGRHARHDAMPLGPFLAAAGVLVWCAQRSG